MDEKQIADQLRAERDKWWRKLLSWAQDNIGWLAVSGLGYALWLVTLVFWKISTPA